MVQLLNSFGALSPKHESGLIKKVTLWLLFFILVIPWGYPLNLYIMEVWCGRYYSSVIQESDRIEK